MQGSLNQYLLRVIVFLIIIVLVIVFLYPVLISAFLSNIYINSVIIISLLFGIIFCLYQIYFLKDSYSILANFNIHKKPQILKNKTGILKNLINELTEKDGHYRFRSSGIDKIIETIENNHIKWKYSNYYWVDPDDGFVWKSIQKIAPNVPEIKLEITKQPDL